ncbi:MAG TPA: VC0807 family protein [Streptosporangiaceae bacterium]|nr:VC0807 family protein [Streptosporangiaceae bacterium]
MQTDDACLTRPVAAPAPAAAPASAPPGAAGSLRVLAIDIAIPLGTYYLLRDGLGASLWLSLAASSVLPAIRSAAGIVARRQLNLLALLMLAVNVAGIGVSLATWDPRLIIAKDSAISSVIGLGILGSVAVRRPLMTAGLKPWLTRGAAGRTAAWDRLLAGSARFRRLESLFSVIWGTVLLGECAARIVGAFTLPVPTMAWLGTVILVSAIGVGVIAGGVAAGPMQAMIEAEAR